MKAKKTPQGPIAQRWLRERNEAYARVAELEALTDPCPEMEDEECTAHRHATLDGKCRRCGGVGRVAKQPETERVIIEHRPEGGLMLRKKGEVLFEFWNDAEWCELEVVVGSWETGETDE